MVHGLKKSKKKLHRYLSKIIVIQIEKSKIKIVSYSLFWPSNQGPDISTDDLQLIMEKVENTMGGANTFELEGRIGDLELKLGGNLQEQIKNTTQIFNEKIETVQNSTSLIKNSVSTLIQGELI